MTKPLALKIANGSVNQHKERHNFNQPMDIGDAGDPPKTLNAGEKKLWHELKGLIYKGVIGEGDKYSLENLVKLLYKSRTDFDSMTGYHFSSMIKLLCEFGMTPVSRNKLIVKKEEKKNSFSDL